MPEKSHVGLNRCFYCGEGFEVLLHKRLLKVFPHSIPPQHLEPCSKCKGWMKKGVVLIGVEEDRSNMEKFAKSWEAWQSERKACGAEFGTPCYEAEMKRAGLHPYMPDMSMVYRSGHFVVVSEDWVKRVIQPESAADRMLKARWTFVDAKICQMLNEQKQAG